MGLQLDITATGFSLANARACAEASRLAYTDPATVESAFAHCRITDVANGAGKCIAFRGTADILDFLEDAKAWFAPSPYGRLHRGFDDTLSTIKRAVYANIAAECIPLFITGHSKGGAEALLFSHYLTTIGVSAQRIHCYTFGQPRIGDKSFADDCNQRLAGRHWRFINRADIVPRLAGYLYGYRHSGEEYFHPFLGDIACNPSIWSKLLTDGAVLYTEWKMGSYALTHDHHVDLDCAWMNSLHSPAPASISATSVNHKDMSVPQAPKITDPNELDALRRMKNDIFSVSGLIEDGLPDCDWSALLQRHATEMVQLIDAALPPGN